MKKKFTFFTLVLAFMSITSMSFAQGTVKGKLVDKDTEEVLIGATVYLESDK